MSTLKELLKNVPVEWKAVSEVCTVFNGYAFDSTKFNNNEIGLPLIRIRDINTGFSNTYYSGDYDERFVVRNGDILIGMDGDFKVTKWSNGKALLNQRVCRLQNFQNYINPNFIFYIIDDVLIKIHNSINSTTVKHLSSRDLNNSTVPIPYPNDPQKSLAIQQEIVRILDSLSEQKKALTTALANEIDNRKKQYAYYREELFRFEGKEVEWKTLGEVLNRTKGTKITAGQMKELDKVGGNIKIFAGGKTVAFFNKEDLPAKDINTLPSIIVKSRGIIEFEYYDKPFSHKNEMWSYNTSNNLIKIKYVYHFLKIKEPYFQNLGSRMQMPQISIPDTDKFKIPIISIPEQERIVHLLDQFDEATKNIVAQLEKEIELRNNQYEYYRNQLLMFNG